jgi:hypothetical protein
MSAPVPQRDGNGGEARSPATSGEGADTALAEMIKKRKQREQPESAPQPATQEEQPQAPRPHGKP